MTGKQKLLKRQKLRNNEYYDMQSVFDELYKNSLAKCEFKNLINIITTEENIRLAYRNLKKNAGSRTPGTDGKTIADLAKMSEPELIQLVQQKFKWYQPQSVRRKEIPKGNGKTRPLGIPTIMDRLIQQCVLQVMEPICEAKFCETSNGFRPNRGVENALAQAEKHMILKSVEAVRELFLDAGSNPFVDFHYSKNCLQSTLDSLVEGDIVKTTDVIKCVFDYLGIIYQYQINEGSYVERVRYGIF